MSAPKWQMHVPTDAHGGGDAGKAARRRGAHRYPRIPLDAQLCAWITGFALAALLCLAFGDTLFALAFGVTP